MNRSEFVKKVVESTDLPKGKAADLVNSVFDEMVEVLKADEKLTITGFGAFEMVTRAPRKARNPKTNEEVLVPAKKTITFGISKTLKDALNE